MKIRITGFLLFAVSFNVFSQTSKSHAADIDYFHMFPGGGRSFPIGVANMFYDRLFVSARYSYDVQDVLCLNAGYIIKPWKADLKIIPTVGLLADRMTGVSPGLQVNYTSRTWVVTSINQVMIDLKDHKYLNNAYDWTEINYIVKDYFRPGITLFEQYNWNQKQWAVSPSVTIFSKIRSFQFYFYAFDFWKKDKEWILTGVSYTHCW